VGTLITLLELTIRNMKAGERIRLLLFALSNLCCEMSQKILPGHPLQRAALTLAETSWIKEISETRLSLDIGGIDADQRSQGGLLDETFFRSK
jgi:hypothetical protein